MCQQTKFQSAAKSTNRFGLNTRYTISLSKRKQPMHKISNPNHPANLRIAKKVNGEMKNSKLLFKQKLSENTKEDKKSFASVRSRIKTASHPEALLSDNNMV